MPASHSIDKEYLLKVARHAIAEYLEVRSPAVPVRKVAGKQGVFVTLSINEELRGCVGCFTSDGDLAETVRQFALLAAFEDSRFPPVEKDELDDIHIEISLLSEPKPTTYDELVKLLPKHPGVVLQKGNHRATFLPQVWEELPRQEEFMAHLCLKAGLLPDEWRKPGVKFETYTVESFEE